MIKKMYLKYLTNQKSKFRLKFIKDLIDFHEIDSFEMAEKFKEPYKYTIKGEQTLGKILKDTILSYSLSLLYFQSLDIVFVYQIYIFQFQTYQIIHLLIFVLARFQYFYFCILLRYISAFYYLDF